MHSRNSLNIRDKSDLCNLSLRAKIHTLYPRAFSSLAEQGYRSINLYLSTSKAVSLPSYSSLKAVNRLRSTFRILARSPMLLSKARNRAQTSLENIEQKSSDMDHYIIYVQHIHATFSQYLTLPRLFWRQASWGEDTFKQNPGVVVLWRDAVEEEKKKKHIRNSA